MAQGFVSVGIFAGNMEAELAKNCLEAEGIRALLTSDSKDPRCPFSLMVAEADEARARACLEGADGSAGNEQPQQAVPEDAAEQLEEAGREFEALRLSELKQKAAGVKSSKMMALAALAAAPVLYVVIPEKSIASRAVLACLLWAVIEFFVWKDARKAAEELKKKFPGS